MVDRLPETGQRYFEIQGDSFVDLGNVVYPIRPYWSWKKAMIGTAGGFLTAVVLGWSFEPLSQVAGFSLVCTLIGGSTRSWSLHSFRERMFPSSTRKLLSPPSSQLATYWMR